MISCTICHADTKLVYKDLFDDRYGAKGKHSIYRCANCGFGQTWPGIKARETSSFYSRYYPLSLVSIREVEDAVNTLPLWVLWFFGNDNVAHYYVKTGMKVLDVGCGNGVSLLEMKKRGVSAIGVEPDPNAQKIKRKLNLNISEGFITDIPPSKKFDAITASQVIEHTANPLNFLTEVKKRLNPHGQIILCFPCIDSIYRKIFGKRWLHWHVPYHLSFLTKKSLQLAGDKVGLRINKIHTITPNLWTIYQLSMIFVGAEEGRMSSFWSFQHEKNDKKESIIDKLVKYIRRFIVSTAIIILIPVNRIIDILGIGDSMLVVVEKK